MIKLLGLVVAAIGGVIAMTSLGVWVAILFVLAIIGGVVLYVHTHYGTSGFEFGNERWDHPALPRRRRRYHRHHRHHGHRRTHAHSS